MQHLTFAEQARFGWQCKQDECYRTTVAFAEQAESKLAVHAGFVQRAGWLRLRVSAKSYTRGLLPQGRSRPAAFKLAIMLRASRFSFSSRWLRGALVSGEQGGRPATRCRAIQAAGRGRTGVRH